MQDVLAWLTSLPPLALYLALALTAALENIFPPLPADTVVAFGSFLAARGEATVGVALVATWLGNVAGAMAVYAAARQWASSGARTRLRRFAGQNAENRLDALYRRWGIAALFLSRFLPGVRAIVPPFAGALKLPAGRVALTIGLASGVWYGLVSIAAYQVGANWEVLQARIASLTRSVGLVAAATAAALGIVWLLTRRRRRVPQ
ncbi:MAG: VTT domain-containing protein [Chloroflexota bacterium]|nr:VTT domain-containing protein [Chloroflexota bacterium]